MIEINNRGEKDGKLLLKDLIGLLSEEGNWNFDPYMMGLVNGLIMANAAITGVEPKFFKTPERWLSENA